MPLVGAAGVRALRSQRASLGADAGLDKRRIDHLLGRYGDRIGNLLDLVADDPRLGASANGAPGYLAAELVYAATHEGALHLDDVLTRRTHASIEGGDGGRAAATAAAGLVGEVLGWDCARQREEVGRFLVEVEADRLAIAAPNDEAAMSARARARSAGR